MDVLQFLCVTPCGFGSLGEKSVTHSDLDHRRDTLSIWVQTWVRRCSVPKVVLDVSKADETDIDLSVINVRFSADLDLVDRIPAVDDH